MIDYISNPTNDFFNDLEKGENPINLLVQIGNKVFEIKNFDVFDCDDNYESVTSGYIIADVGDDMSNWETIIVTGMEATWWWTPFY